MTTPRIALLIAVLWSVVFTSSCGKEPVEQAPVVRPVKIVTIGDTGEATARELPGTIKAAQNADMAFAVSGKITEFLVKEGQRVEKGHVLARLDDRDYQADLDQTKASSRKAQSDLQRSLRIFEEDSGAISTSKIDTDRKSVEVAEAQVRKAEKGVEDTVLRAPFDGVMARKLVEDFQNVQAKESVLVLQDISHLEIAVSVPERDITGGVTSRTAEEITQLTQPEVQISSLPGRSFPARVTEFATSADPITRTFQVRLRFEPPDDVAILPGMTARVTVKVVRDDKIRLPSHATFADADGKPNTWLLDPETMMVQRTPVKLGELTGNEVEILEGLAAGDQVVISGVSQLRDGMQVRRYQ